MPPKKASAIQDIRPGAGGFVSMLVLDMDAYGEKVIRRGRPSSLLGFSVNLT
jgi:hypothetical protein